ncbi:MAG: prolyl oligopeptidase family serine peptidase [Planctomycetaceae bacterium]|nr:prolyl oligopeptidase family serine peptidase [Planctomycetaceae bacterium]
MRITFAVGVLAMTLSAAADVRIGKLELTPVEEIPGDKGNRILVFKHKAVEEMDSPGYVAAGYEYHVTFGVPEGYRPEDKKPIPVILFLHGFGDTWEGIKKSPNWFPNVFTLVPNDPLGTWFYGYSDQLPKGDPNQGMVVNYTERRLLAYLEHFESRYSIDRNRVYVMGGSMGGTGTTSLALRYPNIFAAADARKGATNRVHCKWKSQCESIWGRVESKVKNNDGVNVWDWQNMAWYAQNHQAAATWLRTAHGREDVSIPYRQVAGPPGVTPMSFYAALEAFKIGHECFWDCSSHSLPAPKPFAHDDWWEPFNDATCYFRLDLSFPAFSRYSANDHPGTGAGDAVGSDSQLGDNTYDGDPNGGFNRFLRWNSATISDQESQYSIEIKLSSGPNGYKGKGEVVDVTPRRLQKFKVTPGATYSWSTSAPQSGSAVADAEGLLTIPAVKVGPAWTKLTIQASSKN